MDMTLTTLDIPRLASSVLELLKDLHGHLDASMDPERRALRALNLDPRLGWTKLAYTEEAFDIWYKFLKQDSRDYRTIHHLAIMHHARAIDYENSNKPRKSNADWEKAMQYWCKLYKNDKFWDSLAVIACKGTKRDALDQLREDFPKILLQIHYDIAMDEETRKQREHRAVYHIGLAQSAPFSEEAKNAVRRDTYTHFIRTVPDNVWQINELNPDVIKQGTDRIEEYLMFDPGCIPALEDALRLQVRLLRARHAELQAMGQKSPKRKKLLNSLKKDADYWRDYFVQLVGIRDLDDDIRQKLGLWFRVTAEIFRALDQHENAIGLYEKGVEVCSEGSDEGRRCRRELGDTMAFVAREWVHKKQPGARGYCERVRNREDLSVSAICILANAYTLLNEFDIAKMLCQRGMEIEPEITDFDAMQEHERDRQRLVSMLDNIERERAGYQMFTFFEETKNHLQAGRCRQALEVVNEAIVIDDTQVSAYFLRAQAFLGLKRYSEAKSDLKTVKRLAEKQPKSDMILTAAREMEQRIKEIEELEDGFGGPEAFDLRQRAIQAANTGNHSDAIMFLRQALDSSKHYGHRNGAPKLKKELSMVLTNAAIDKANKAQQETMDLQQFGPRGLQDIFRNSNFGARPSLSDLLSRNPFEKMKIQLLEADDMLSEAIRLDRNNTRASQSRETIQELINQLP